MLVIMCESFCSYSSEVSSAAHEKHIPACFFCEQHPGNVGIVQTSIREHADSSSVVSITIDGKRYWSLCTHLAWDCFLSRESECVVAETRI